VTYECFRYAQNNTYVGFYRIVHDSKHPGDEIPPVPHPSAWFSHLEAGMARNGSASPVHGRIRDDQSPDDEDEEIAIERERISLKCPLTFSTFEDPVKSTKCVHSFERQAIEDLIKNSTMTIAAGDKDFQGGGRGARARRVRAVQCPVCSVVLTLNDLKRDPVLLRRVLRAKAAEQREEEEAQFEGRHHHRKGGRKSGFTIASDDDDEVSIDDDDEDEVEVEDEKEDTRNRIKRERSRYSSRAPHAVDEIEDD
jgi:mRNA (guanine-N7-)-methyltransferase